MCIFKISWKSIPLSAENKQSNSTKHDIFIEKNQEALLNATNNINNHFPNEAKNNNRLACASMYFDCNVNHHSYRLKLHFICMKFLKRHKNTQHRKKRKKKYNSSKIFLLSVMRRHLSHDDIFEDDPVNFSFLMSVIAQFVGHHNHRRGICATWCSDSSVIANRN